MRLSVQEILIIVAVVVVVVFAGKIFMGRKKNAKAKKASSSANSSSAPAKLSGNAVQTLRYAAIAFAFIGAILLLAASQIEKYSMYLYIAGGVFAGGGVIFFILSLKAKQ